MRSHPRTMAHRTDTRLPCQLAAGTAPAVMIRSNPHTEEIEYVAHTGGDLTHEGSKLVEAWLSARRRPHEIGAQRKIANEMHRSLEEGNNHHWTVPDRASDIEGARNCDRVGLFGDT